MSQADDTGARRRLAAILAADAVGYSRLIALDDRGTLAALDAARAQFREQAAAHGGRVVDTAGDSVLAVFETASGAMVAAIEVQRKVQSLAAAQPADQALRFRIGLHLGDVIEKADGSVYGDGVNVAARLQALATPGGIGVSDAVRAAVGQRVVVGYEDAGLQQVKNIAQPVRVFHLQDAAAAARLPLWRRLSNVRWPRWGLAAGLVLGAAGITGALWLQRGAGASDAGAITMSVALGPIATAPGDAAAAAEAERLARALATGISAYSGHVRVVSPAASGASDAAAFRYAARRAGARYVVEGDLLAGASPRELNLRLIDTGRGTQSWSGSIELPGPTAGAAMQVALRGAVDVLAFAVGDAEVRRVLPKPVAQLDPMERVVRSYGVLGKGPSLANAREAIELLEAARQQDPTLVPALLMMGDALETLRDVDPQLDPQRFTQKLDEVSLRATTLEPDSPIAWHGRSSALMRLRRWDAALEASDRFVRLDRYNPRAVVQHAELLVALGRPAAALPLTEKAMAMSPLRRGERGALITACHAHLLLGASALAVGACEKANVSDEVLTWTLLAAAYAHAGDDAQARAAVAALLKLVPKFTVGMARAKGASDHPEYLKLADRTLFDGLRKAGLGE